LENSPKIFYLRLRTGQAGNGTALARNKVAMLAYRLFMAEMDNVPEGVFQRIGAALGAGFQPCIGPARELQASLLDIEPQSMSAEPAPTVAAFGQDEGPAIIGGEIFSNKSSFVAITVEMKDAPARRIQFNDDGLGPQDATFGPKRLSMFYMGPAYVSEHIQKIKGAVEAAFGVTLAPKTYRSKSLTTLREDGRVAPEKPTERDLTAALVLSSRPVRTLAMAIKAAGGLLVRDLAKQLPGDARQGVEEVRRLLERAGLITADVVVVCSRTGAQVARIPNREVLQTMANSGIRCGCGRAITEERSEESIALTELGARLLEGNRWLTVLLVRELMKVGVSLDDMLVDQAPGDDEVDCIADIGGELVLFQVKDKDFNLGDAYGFGAKVGMIRPEHSVVVSTERIGADAREHFDRAHRSRRPEAWHGDTSRPAVRYIEGLETLGGSIEELAAGIYQGDALRFLRRVLPLAGLKPQPLIQAMEQRASRRADAPAALQAEPASQAA
jgi:hypothetical protein